MRTKLFVVIGLAAALSGCGEESGDSYSLSAAKHTEDGMFTVMAFRGESGDTCFLVSPQVEGGESVLFQLTDKGPVKKSADTEDAYFGEDGFNCGVKLGNPTYRIQSDGSVSAVDR